MNISSLDEELIVRQNGNNTQQLLRVSSRPLSRPDQTLFAIEDVCDGNWSCIRRQRLAAGVFENNQDGIILLNHQGVITVINPKVTELLGYNNEDVVNKPIDDVLAWNQFSSFCCQVSNSRWRILDNGKERYGKGIRMVILYRVCQS